MGGFAPQTPQDLSLFLPEWMLLFLPLSAVAVQWRSLIGG